MASGSGAATGLLLAGVLAPIAAAGSMRDPDGYLIEVGQSTGLLHGKLATP